MHFDAVGLADYLPLWGPRGKDWSCLDGASGVKSRHCFRHNVTTSNMTIRIDE